MADYSDIISLPAHRSRNHPPMSPQARAAQFAPFAALTGYDSYIREQARTTEQRPELSDDSLARLNEQLQILTQEGNHHPVKITYFQEDGRKAGGHIITCTGTIRKADEYRGTLVLEEGTVLPLADILSIGETGENFSADES